MKAILLVLLVIFFISTPSTFAQSAYVLPYPPSMPGSKLYSIRLFTEHIQYYWYFGNFSQFTYNMKLADKYLVEAKTLFEYKQYLLADAALQKSNRFLEKAAISLREAKKEGKAVEEKERLFLSAIEKHIEVLLSVRTLVPDHFTWTPEKSAPTELNIHASIDRAIELRRSCYE